MPLLIIHGDVDVRVPEAHSADFAVAAVAPHRDIDYSMLPGLGHMDDIDPTAPHWPVAVDWMERRSAESRATDRWAGTG
ncbi:alpha/beta hydrolase family protein [Arthrobacter livingstonensis]|uniref:alpha/beta hydrolase family protein n=1 Tax=Arthrobacter livingstonensis TaxID=670078 RepID=UPI0026D2ECF7